MTSTSITTFIIIIIIHGSRTDECQGGEIVQGIQGSFTLDRSTPNSENRDYKLVNASGPLVLEVHLSTIHQSSNCAQAIDFIILPDGHKHCTEDTFCRVYVPPSTTNNNSTSGYSTSVVTAVRKRCGEAWRQATEWPPTICVQRRLDSFTTDIIFRFYKSQDSRIVDLLKDVTVDKQAAEPNAMIAVIAVVVVLVLMLIIGIAYKFTKRRQSTARESEIAPYAVHISIRRRSENRGHHEVVNHYDAVPPDVVRDSYYMQPVRESPYYEIDNNTVARGDATYTMAEQVEKYPTNLLGQAKWRMTNTPAMPNANSMRYSGYVEMAKSSGAAPTRHRSVSMSDSFSSVSDEQPVHSPYGEIIGVVNEDGTIERLNPPRVQYKSVKKKRKSNETADQDREKVALP